MSVAEIQTYEQPQLGEIFGQPVERVRFQFKDLGGALKDMGGSRAAEMDEVLTFTVRGRVIAVGGQRSEVMGHLDRFHLVEVVEVELEPDSEA